MSFRQVILPVARCVMLGLPLATAAAPLVAEEAPSASRGPLIERFGPVYEVAEPGFWAGHCLITFHASILLHESRNIPLSSSGHFRKERYLIPRTQGIVERFVATVHGNHPYLFLRDSYLGDKLFSSRAIFEGYFEGVR